MRRIGTATSPMRYRTIPTEGVGRVTKAIGSTVLWDAHYRYPDLG